MVISPSLKQFVSSGTYRLTKDNSQVIGTSSAITKLIPGFSKKGPFNTPVYVQDKKFFLDVFGDIDKKLERNGSFFHRTALAALETGPIIALNLLKLDDTLDKTSYVGLSVNSSIANTTVKTTPVSTLFNTDKFWFADPLALQDVNTGAETIPSRELIAISNIGRKPISVIVRKSDTIGFEIMAKDWFGSNDVPFFLDSSDYISDYMLDVIVVDGNWSNYNTLSIDPTYGDLFDATGLKKTYVDKFGNTKDALTAFLNLSTVNVLGVYTGSVIPDFLDKNGVSLFIEDIVNLETNKTGLMISVNRDLIDSTAESFSGGLIDTVGHNIESEEPTQINFLSYFGNIIDTFDYTTKFGESAIDSGYAQPSFVTSDYFVYKSDLVIGPSGATGINAVASASSTITAATGYTAGRYDTIEILSTSPVFASTAEFESFANAITVGKSYVKCSSHLIGGTTTAVNYAHVVQKTYDKDLQKLTIKIALRLATDSGITGPKTGAQGYFYIPAGSLSIIVKNDWVRVNSTDIFAGQDSNLYTDYLNGIVTEDDKVIVVGDTNETISVERTYTNDLSTVNAVFLGATAVLSSKVNYIKLTSTATAIKLTDNLFNIVSYVGNINESIETDQTLTDYINLTNVVWLDNTTDNGLGLNWWTGKIIKGQYLVQAFDVDGTIVKLNPLTGKSRLTKILSVIEDTNPLSTTYKKIKVTAADPIFISPARTIERYQDIRNFVDHYRFTKLDGYTLRDAQIPNGTLTRQNEILDFMWNTNLANALIDKEIITYRYIVDSFEGAIEGETKSRLTRLAKERENALAILNLPSVKQFKECTNPLFKFNSTSNFDAAYIADGGNLSLNPSNVFTLPTIDNGSNFGVYYGPNLIIRENGANVSVPPAGYISNLYTTKWSAGLPYDIIAGPRRGIVSAQGLVGVEYNFDRNDLDKIEPWGYNAILNKRGLGLVINANNTGQQNIKSALSQAHVRELVIYIQDAIEDILKNYRWQFNTVQNRLEIKTLVDNLSAQIISDGGAYNIINVMDTTNNTEDIINANMGVIDTYLEPVRGMGILVQRTTILKTGSIARGQF